MADVRLPVFVSMLREIASWDWNLVGHATTNPNACHPTALRVGRAGLEKVLAKAKSCGDAELEADCQEALQNVLKAGSGKADKADDVQDA